MSVALAVVVGTGVGSGIGVGVVAGVGAGVGVRAGSGAEAMPETLGALGAHDQVTPIPVIRTSASAISATVLSSPDSISQQLSRSPPLQNARLVVRDQA